jgi:hypothetical protein
MDYSSANPPLSQQLAKRKTSSRSTAICKSKPAVMEISKASPLVFSSFAPAAGILECISTIQSASICRSDVVGIDCLPIGFALQY